MWLLHRMIYHLTRSDLIVRAMRAFDSSILKLMKTEPKSFKILRKLHLNTEDLKWFIKGGRWVVPVKSTPTWPVPPEPRVRSFCTDGYRAVSSLTFNGVYGDWAGIPKVWAKAPWWAVKVLEVGRSSNSNISLCLQVIILQYISN